MDKVACIYLDHSCPLRIEGWACPSFDKMVECEEENELEGEADNE